MKYPHFKRWGAVYVLLALFAASLLGQFVFMVQGVEDEAILHGSNFAWSEFWPVFLGAVFENWQSEWLQLVLQAVVLLGMKHLLFAADAEDMEVVQRDLIEIKQALGLPANSGGKHHRTG